MRIEAQEYSSYSFVPYIVKPPISNHHNAKNW